MAYSIMSFNMSFYENVIKGTARRIKNSKTPFATMSGVLPSVAALYFAQTLFSVIRYSLTNPEKWEEEEGENWLDKAIQPKMFSLGFTRAFPLGVLDTLIQTTTGIKYDRSLQSIFGGAYVGHFMDALAKILLGAFGKNSPLSNSAERNMAKGLFEIAAAPTINYALSRVPGGPILKPVYGVGMQNLTSQRTKSKFADAVAGEKYSFTPSAFTLLQERGYSPKDIANDPDFKPSGKKGTILKSDVEAWLAKR
jgi:hypothetical protein